MSAYITLAASPSSGRMEAGSPAIFDNMVAAGIGIYGRLGTISSNNGLISKGSSSTGWSLAFTGTFGKIRLTIQRATQDAQYDTAGTPFSGMGGAWRFIGLKFDMTDLDNVVASVILGPDGGGTLVEYTLAKTTQGSGLYAGDGAAQLKFANSGSNGAVQPGDYGPAVIFAGEAPSLARFQSWHETWDETETGVDGQWMFGEDGNTTQNDATANNNDATITSGTASATGGPTADVAAKIATLVTAFPGTTLPASFVAFDSGTGSHAVANGALTFSLGATPGDYSYVDSVEHYDMIASSVFTQIRPNGAISSEIGIHDDLGHGYYLFIDTSTNQIDINRIVTGVRTLISSTAYNAANHYQIRFREAGGTIYFEAKSRNAVSWTALFSEAWNTNASFDPTSVIIYLAGADVGTPSTSTSFDSVNVAPTRISRGASLI